MKTTKKPEPTMAFIAQPTTRLRVEAATIITRRVSYVWRPGNKRMEREKSA
jgi:hypothetical protein